MDIYDIKNALLIGFFMAFMIGPVFFMLIQPGFGLTVGNALRRVLLSSYFTVHFSKILKYKSTKASVMKDGY